jgi:predicted GIY-YIG superfamily endonuclease
MSEPLVITVATLLVLAGLRLVYPPRRVIPQGGRTALYRYYDARGRLLYIGITNSVTRRDNQHGTGKRWRSQIATSRVEWFPTRTDALEAERRAIRREHPAFNIQHARRRPRR